MATGLTQPEEEAWIQDQRRTVEEYLQRQQCDHGGVAEYPAFHIYPGLALWAVQSKKAPGWVGWWAISGDLPTDYIGRNEAANPREAVLVFARHWREAAECMLRGEEPPDCSIGPPNRRLELGELLKRRAEILQECADEEGLWDADGGPAEEVETEN